MTDLESTGRLVLLVEDNIRILAGNKRMLEWEGYSVTTAKTLAQARLRLKEKPPDIIVLDTMLPDGNGLDFMRELRQGSEASVPVLLLTGLTTQEDILCGLRSGGDDYLTKPYDFKILLARIEALLRRSERVPRRIVKGRFSLELTSGSAVLDGVDLLLTQKEFSLLVIFLQNPGRFLDGEYLYKRVWNQPMGADSNAMKSAIKRLRSKIEGSGWQITWSRGEGYCFEKEFLL